MLFSIGDVIGNFEILDFGPTPNNQNFIAYKCKQTDLNEVCYVSPNAMLWVAKCEKKETNATV